MKIAEPDPSILHGALEGSLAAMDALITTIQPGVYKLAVHVLGNRDDAADATQEILLKAVTRLSGFRFESAFSTWVWRVAYNHLMTARTRKAESPEVSLDGIAERLEHGLEFAAQLARDRGEPGPLSPQDKLEARQIALGCTQSMLMALDREQRLAYVIDTVFGLDSLARGCGGGGHLSRSLPSTTVARAFPIGCVHEPVLRARQPRGHLPLRKAAAGSPTPGPIERGRSRRGGGSSQNRDGGSRAPVRCLYTPHRCGGDSARAPCVSGAAGATRRHSRSAQEGGFPAARPTAITRQAIRRGAILRTIDLQCLSKL